MHRAAVLELPLRRRPRAEIKDAQHTKEAALLEHHAFEWNQGLRGEAVDGQQACEDGNRPAPFWCLAVKPAARVGPARGEQECAREREAEGQLGVVVEDMRRNDANEDAAERTTARDAQVVKRQGLGGRPQSVELAVEQHADPEEQHHEIRDQYVRRERDLFEETLLTRSKRKRELQQDREGDQ